MYITGWSSLWIAICLNIPEKVFLCITACASLNIPEKVFLFITACVSHIFTLCHYNMCLNISEYACLWNAARVILRFNMWHFSQTENNIFIKQHSHQAEILHILISWRLCKVSVNHLDIVVCVAVYICEYPGCHCRSM